MKISNQMLLAFCMPLLFFTACTKQEVDAPLFAVEQWTDDEVYELIEKDLDEMLPHQNEYNQDLVLPRSAEPLAFEGQLNLTVTPWYNRSGLVVGAILRDRGYASDNISGTIKHACSARVHFKSAKVFAGHSFHSPGRYFVRFRKMDNPDYPVINPDLTAILNGIYLSKVTRGALEGQLGVGQRIAAIDQNINKLEDLLGLINVTATFSLQSNLEI